MKELHSTARSLVLVEVGEQLHFDDDVQLAADAVHRVEDRDPAGHHRTLGEKYYEPYLEEHRAQNSIT